MTKDEGRLSTAKVNGVKSLNPISDSRARAEHAGAGRAWKEVSSHKNKDNVVSD